MDLNQYLERMSFNTYVIRILSHSDRRSTQNDGRNEPRSGPEIKDNKVSTQIKDLARKPPFSYFLKCLTEGTEKNPIIGDLRGTFQIPVKFL
jgi:hypothetical protein